MLASREGRCRRTMASREGRCRRTRAERLGELRAQESLDICFDVLSCGDQGLQSGLS